MSNKPVFRVKFTSAKSQDFTKPITINKIVNGVEYFYAKFTKELKPEDALGILKRRVYIEKLNNLGIVA